MGGAVRRRCRTSRRVSRSSDAFGIRAPPSFPKQVCAASQAFEKGESKTLEIGGQYYERRCPTGVMAPRI